jgi:hypothetical protein
MYIVEDIKKLEDFYGRVALTIGNFDGFHQGHLRIIRTLVRESENRALIPTVLTFKQHPLSLLFNKQPQKLSAPCDKIKLFEKEGIELLFYIEFTREFADLDALSFLSNLESKLGPRLYCLGQGFRFGRGNSGNTSLLQRYGAKFGFDLVLVSDVRWDGTAVSSTRIRNEVKKGNFTLVKHLLGKRYYAYLICIQTTPPVFVSFFSDWALPARGRFSGCIEDVRTKGRIDIEVDVSGGIFNVVSGVPLTTPTDPAVNDGETGVTRRRHGAGPKIEKYVQVGRLYRFYFNSLCEQ